ncbi:putative bifunctional diguanylate cyclase/phosphodiesterase [Allosphingosinicella indica]|uniref:Diguanylate cyclase (GGDEF) domain-containing protein n=1 Tax=Allosphingosinicella indica TaxID=941907 RepID=A0A1X7G6B8_9SPHN|nr:GGDEF and EAL domain-containing protein [Allosphingosinicella indica]SMF64829.1 diguanylate cyclase (GGDEF) domain-containing protein [Allosphingosinicella indica]
MYQTPVSVDAGTEIDIAERPAGDPLAYGDGSDRLVEAHLRNGQLAVAALFAPYFAISAVGAALLVAWGLYGNASTPLIAGWLCLLSAAHWLACRKTIDAGTAAGSRSAAAGTRWRPILTVTALGALWSSLPAWAFATQPHEVQVVIGGAMGAMLIAAIALAAIPVAAMAWMATITVALCLAYWFSAAMHTGIGIAIIGVAVIAVTGVARLTRWVFAQLKDMASVKASAESIRAMLDEYEHRGAGWLWQVDPENRVVYISSRMITLLGRSASQIIGHSLPAALGGNGALGKMLLAKKPFANLEMEISTRRGTRWVSLAGDPVVDMAGRFQGFRGVGTDITDFRKNQERLTNLANMDVLSGLPNRGRVRQLLGEALSAACADTIPCAVLFLDLDGFKPVNDTFGHPKGDLVLKSVAQRLVKEVGPMGIVGRMGGDEFAIVIRDAQSRTRIEKLAENLIEAVAAPYHLGKVEIRIGVSVGCAFGPIDGQSVDDLIQKADIALYQAKANGRGIFCHYNADMQSAADHRIRLEKDLAHGIQSGQLRLLYQPLIDASNQSLTGFEALVRWHHPTRGLVPPNDFIPLAEETGLIVPLGEWVMEEACRAAATWPEHISVAINMSARQLVLPSLPATVNSAISRHRIQPDRLELEVTESVFLEDSAGALDVLKRLRALGVGIALDDFGTGYSSLGYLNKAVFHKLKIDGSFVREAAENKETVAIIQSIVQLARNFRMTITAEGVETADDFMRMKDLGCHQIQGYLFGKPMSYDRASELVQGAPMRMSA